MELRPGVGLRGPGGNGATAIIDVGTGVGFGGLVSIGGVAGGFARACGFADGAAGTLRVGGSKSADWG